MLDVAADGIRAPDLQVRLDQLESQRASLASTLAKMPGLRPALHPDLAQIYRERVHSLSQALSGLQGVEALEAARMLIDKVIVSPSDDNVGASNTKLTGPLAGMLGIAGLAPQSQGLAANDDRVFSLFAGSVKGVSGG